MALEAPLKMDEHSLGTMEPPVHCEHSMYIRSMVIYSIQKVSKLVISKNPL